MRRALVFGDSQTEALGEVVAGYLRGAGLQADVVVHKGYTSEKLLAAAQSELNPKAGRALPSDYLAKHPLLALQALVAIASHGDVNGRSDTPLFWHGGKSLRERAGKPLCDFLGRWSIQERYNIDEFMDDLIGQVYDQKFGDPSAKREPTVVISKASESQVAEKKTKEKKKGCC